MSSAANADVKVLNQNGQEQEFFSEILKDHAIIINFIYTHCEGVCPNQGKRFEQLQTLISASGRSDIKLISLSIDPERDTPVALKKWAERFKAQRIWTLVTTNRTDMEALCRQILGMTLSTGDHSPYLAIRDKKGAWQPLYGMTPAREILAKLDPFSSSSQTLVKP